MTQVNSANVLRMYFEKVRGPIRKCAVHLPALGRPGPLALRLCGHGLLRAAWAASCPLGRPVACAWAALVVRHLGHRLPAAGPADGRLGLVRLLVAELAILFNMAEACKSVIN